MRDNGEIPNLGEIRHGFFYGLSLRQVRPNREIPDLGEFWHGVLRP